MNIADAGVGSPINEDVCLESVLNFAKRIDEKMGIKKAIKEISKKLFRYEGWWKGCNNIRWYIMIPGARPKEFPAGIYETTCALIIGKRKDSTNKKTSLNDALRTFEVQVWV